MKNIAIALALVAGLAAPASAQGQAGWGGNPTIYIVIGGAIIAGAVVLSAGGTSANGT